MERIRGLEEYVKNKEYREALGLPKEKTENYELLAQGEYNINYSFTHPKTGKLCIYTLCDRKEITTSCELWKPDASGASD